MSKIYNDLYKRVEKMVGVFQVSHKDFDDVVQLVMLDIFEKKLELKTIGSKLLYVMTRNTIADRYRQEARILRYLDSNMYFNSAGTICDSSAEGLEIYRLIEEQKRKEKELDEKIDLESLMPPLVARREIIDLHLQGLTYKQIAHHLKIRIGTVRSRLHYARKLNRVNRQ